MIHIREGHKLVTEDGKDICKICRVDAREGHKTRYWINEVEYYQWVDTTAKKYIDFASYIISLGMTPAFINLDAANED